MPSAHMDTNQNDRTSTTLYDVAREAGVSPMTVSRVINGRNHVSPTTRARARWSRAACRRG